MSEKESMTPQEAYNRLLEVLQDLKTVEEQQKINFEYSPFDYIHSQLERNVRECRDKLIEKTAERLQKQHMPNAKPEIDFKKLMTERCGDLGFDEHVIEEWFTAAISDKKVLTEKSLEHIIDTAKHLVPYMDNGGEWGSCKDWKKLVEDRVLELKAYTWRGASSYSPGSLNYSINSRGEFDAFEKLVDLVTLTNKDAATVKPLQWLTTHIRKERQGAAGFYGRQLANHPAVGAFEFFKNDKLKIWFKTVADAEAVARALVSGEIQPRPAPLLLVSTA